MDYGKTFFSLVDVVNVYGDKNFLSGVHTQKKHKNHKKINKNTKLKVRDTQFYIFILFLLIYFYDSDTIYSIFSPHYDTILLINT